MYHPVLGNCYAFTPPSNLSEYVGAVGASDITVNVNFREAFQVF
jgi:hypothetical protein